MTRKLLPETMVNMPSSAKSDSVNISPPRSMSRSPAYGRPYTRHTIIASAEKHLSQLAIGSLTIMLPKA